MKREGANSSLYLLPGVKTGTSAYIGTKVVIKPFNFSNIGSKNSYRENIRLSFTKNKLHYRDQRRQLLALYDTGNKNGQLAGSGTGTYRAEIRSISGVKTVKRAGLVGIDTVLSPLTARTPKLNQSSTMLLINYKTNNYPSCSFF